MSVQDLGEWLDEQSEHASFLWAKRLSANDTQATGGHQAGPHIPKAVIFDFLPELNDVATRNPKVQFSVTVDSHQEDSTVTATWYNNKLTDGGTRNEARITNWGGSGSSLLDSENAGTIIVFAFRRSTEDSLPLTQIWVCANPDEEDLVADFLGPVNPGMPRRWPRVRDGVVRRGPCFLSPSNLPAGWLEEYPIGQEMLAKIVELRPARSESVDRRLIARWTCGSHLYESLEEAVELPRIRAGYNSVDEFSSHALSVLQRRRSRAGGILELNVRQILLEENLKEGLDFDYKKKTEGRSEPDFLFPNISAYHDKGFPKERLRMLAIKTTLKDRWRQILREAERIPEKHLLTLEENLTPSQFEQIQGAGVKLVVPESRRRKFDAGMRAHISTLESFIREVRKL